MASHAIRWALVVSAVVVAAGGCSARGAGSGFQETARVSSPLTLAEDGDQDGVRNERDQCPATPAGEKTDGAGCGLSTQDADFDGVGDALDLCPGTDPISPTDAAGCSRGQGAVLPRLGPSSRDTGDIFQLAGWSPTATGCAGTELPRVEVDSDDDGVADTLVVASATVGNAALQASGSPLNRRLALLTNCTTPGNADVSIRFVDMLASGFDRVVPASWTFRTVPAVRIDFTSDFLFGTHFDVDGLTPTGVPAIAFNDFRRILSHRDGIAEIRAVTDYSNNLLDNLRVLVQHPNTRWGTNVSVLVPWGMVRFPSVTTPGNSFIRTQEIPSASPLPANTSVCGPFITGSAFAIETSADIGPNSQACISWPAHCSGPPKFLVLREICGVPPACDHTWISAQTTVEANGLACATVGTDPFVLTGLPAAPDTVAPLILVPGPITVNAPTPAGTRVTFSVVAQDDRDPFPVVACVPPSGSIFPLGDTLVTCVGQDAAGNTSSQSFIVHVDGPGGPGQPCGSTAECAQGACVDGVCCEEECGGGVNDCQACSVAAGGTVDGSCTAVVDARPCGTSGACRVAATCSPTSKQCPDDTPTPAGTRCDAPANFCDWIQPICDQATLSCPAHDPWPADTCKLVSSLGPTDLGDGQDTPGGVTVTPDGPPSGDVSIAVQQLTEPPTCPSATPAAFKAGSPAQYWKIETSPAGTPLPATVCFNYLPTSLTLAQQCGMQLHHGDATTCDWGSSMGSDICPSNGHFCWTTTPCVSDTRSAGTICGHVDHFSPFAVFAPALADIPAVTVPASMVVAATEAAGAVVTFEARAHDTQDGDIGVQCTPASGSKFPLGTTTVVCSATDSQGFRGESSFTVRVQVQAPTDGTFFLPPINPDGSSIFKLGSAIPVKFKLTGGSAGITNLVAHLTVAKVSNSVTGSYAEAASPGAANTGDTFRYDCVAHQYIFNLSTKTLSKGTWSLRADLGDGVDHAINVSLR